MIEKTASELTPGDSICGRTIAIIETLLDGETVKLTFTDGSWQIYYNARFFVEVPMPIDMEVWGEQTN